MYIELKSIEIRTEVEESSKTGGTEGREAESQNPLEETWNHEPLDHTKSTGKDRLVYGCPYSREDGVKFNVRTCGNDMFTEEAMGCNWQGLSLRFHCRSLERFISQHCGGIDCCGDDNVQTLRATTTC